VPEHAGRNLRRSPLSWWNFKSDANKSGPEQAVRGFVEGAKGLVKEATDNVLVETSSRAEPKPLRCGASTAKKRQ
jgi:hypothetical protein